MKEYTLGSEWFGLHYPIVRESLGYSEQQDSMSRDVLSTILSSKEIIQPETISRILEDRIVVMFGAGPSLNSDLRGLMSLLQDRRFPLVAADGAADALYEMGITPSMVVTDLDSCSVKNLERNSREGYVFAHAHGDNLDLVEKIVPRLGSRLFGTTQVKSVDRVVNFGGLTDGDRACYIISYYNPRAIIVAGMDYGVVEGHYSKAKYNKKPTPLRPLKLELGKRSLEFLIEKRKDIRFYNVTDNGEDIKGTARTSYSEVTLAVH